MEGKPPISHPAFSPIGHPASPTYFDPPNQISDPMQTQPILTQLFPVTGTIPKPTNPFYQLAYQTPVTQEEIRTHTNQITSPTNYPPSPPPIDNLGRILASTPTTNVGLLTPSQEHTQTRSANLYVTDMNMTRDMTRDMSMTSDDNLIKLEAFARDATHVQDTQTRTRTTNIFEPIKGRGLKVN